MKDEIGRRGGHYDERRGTPTSAADREAASLLEIPPRGGTDGNNDESSPNVGPPQHSQPLPQPERARRQSSRGSVQFVSTVQQLDVDERPSRLLSVVRRESFVGQFLHTRGPPQIAFLMFLIALALGSTIGVVPAVMTDRFARTRHGYPSDAPDCSAYADPGMARPKPEECLLGSADAQTAVSAANLISNVLTFATSSLMGSLSDEYGRRGKDNSNDG